MVKRCINSIGRYNQIKRVGIITTIDEDDSFDIDTWEQEWEQEWDSFC